MQRNTNVTTWNCTNSINLIKIIAWKCRWWCSRCVVHSPLRCFEVKFLRSKTKKSELLDKECWINLFVWLIFGSTNLQLYSLICTQCFSLCLGSVYHINLVSKKVRTYLSTLYKHDHKIVIKQNELWKFQELTWNSGNRAGVLLWRGNDGALRI